MGVLTLFLSRSRMNMPLLEPYRWLVVACFVGLLPLMLWRTAEWSEAEALQQLSQQGERRLQQYVHGLVSALRDYEIVPLVLSQDHDVRELLLNPGAPEPVQAIHRRFEQLNPSLRGAVIFVMDRRGWTVAASNGQASDSFVGKNDEFRPYFRQALAGHPGPHGALGVTSGSVGYYVSARVTLNDQVLGVVVVKRELSDRSEGFDEDMEFLVADRNGVIFLTHRPEWRFRTLRPLEPWVREWIDRGRQFEGLELPPLPIRTTRPWNATATIIELAADAPVSGPAVSGAGRYLVQTRLLPEHGWQAQILIPFAAVRPALVEHLLVAGLAWLLALALALYGLKHRAALRLWRETAHTDRLTGLHNRRYLVNATATLLHRYHRGPISGIAVLVLEIDDFGKILDLQGRKAGDEVLVRVAGALRAALRAGDVPVRLNSERFMALLAIRSGEDVRPVVDRIRKQVKALRLTGKLQSLELTVSVGVAYYQPPEPLDLLIERTERRLREAKQQGRDQVCAPPLGEDATGP